MKSLAGTRWSLKRLCCENVPEQVEDWEGGGIPCKVRIQLLILVTQSVLDKMKKKRKILLTPLKCPSGIHDRRLLIL